MPDAIAFTTASHILSERLHQPVTIRDNPSSGVRGALDARDTYELQRAGVTETQKLGKVMFDDIALRARIVDAAFALEASGASFSQWSSTDAVNDRLWWLGMGGKIGARKFLADGTLGSPAAALRDVFENGEQYGFECATAMMVIFHKAVLDTVGDEVFDRMFTDPGYFKIFRWSIKDQDFSDLEVIDRTTNDLVPGSHYYYKNPAVADEHAAFAGENVIYLGVHRGKRRFYAHGVVGARGTYVVTEKELLRSLRALRKRGATEKPFREMFTYSLNARKLAAKIRQYAT